jgi:hypothetical protein
MENKKQLKGISRRHLMHLSDAGVLAAGLGTKLIVPNQATATEVSEVTADQALQKLHPFLQIYPTKGRLRRYPTIPSCFRWDARKIFL